MEYLITCESLPKPNLTLTRSQSVGGARREWRIRMREKVSFYCVPAWRVTDWLTENWGRSFRIGPLLCVRACVCLRVYYIWRGHWVMITQGNLKAWMWVVGNVFCFIEITFHNPDDTERLWWSYASWYRDVTCVEMWLKCFKEFVFRGVWWNGFFPFSDAWILLFWVFFFLKMTVLKETWWTLDAAPNSGFWFSWHFISLSRLNCCKNTHAPEPKIPLRNWHSWPESNTLDLYNYENEFVFFFFVFFFNLHPSFQHSHVCHWYQQIWLKRT